MGFEPAASWFKKKSCQMRYRLSYCASEPNEEHFNVHTIQKSVAKFKLE